MDTREEDPTVPLLARVTCDPLVSPAVQMVVTEGPEAGATFCIEDLSHRRAFIGKSPVCEVLLSVGGDKWAKVDVCILAATRRDLDREVQARRFRDDLVYRLAVARVELPPLRKRRGDVALLAACFWKTLGGDDAMLPPEVLQRFEAHEWPGNVRELHNAVARQIALGEVTFGKRAGASTWTAADAAAAAADADDGSDFIDHLVQQGLPFSRGRQEATAEYDRRYVKRMLELHGDDVGAAAAASGIGRRYFQKLRTKV